MSEIHQILEKYWGYKSFRPMQEEIIDSVLNGKDTLALLPTGGGKSICFQVPALYLNGICIVITPLIALMKDQVENLKKRNIKAVAIYSGMSKREVDLTLDNCIYDKEVKFLYCSPERLKTDILIERVKKMKIGLLAIDEAHCISQWGYDFRPPYLEISQFRSLLPKTPCIALTATATKQVCEDIQVKLAFSTANVFKKSFARENLSYSCFYSENKEEKLLEILNNVPGTSVVYVRSRNKTKTIAQFLQQNLISADYYHAGLENNEREQKQHDWINNKIRVIVSTNAFGMGIDKPDVRTVIHIDMPDNPEAYYQEAGRAGRDEKHAYAVLLYDLNDIDRLNERVENSNPDIKTIKQTYQALCNYYNLAIGSAFMESFELDISAFCNHYDLAILPTFNSIKKLQNQGLIQLNESFLSSSKIFFSVEQKRLYEFQVANKHLDEFIKSLLRTYGGELFNHHINISEKKIAANFNLKIEEVYRNLELLHENEIIDYIKLSGKPKLTFLMPRQDVKNLPLDLNFLKEQKELSAKKAQTMTNYAKSENRCRTQQLLEYFDEITDDKCGVCDFCLRTKKKSGTTEDLQDIEAAIVKLLMQNPLRIDELTTKLAKFKRERVSMVITEMLDNQQLALDEFQKLSLV